MKAEMDTMTVNGVEYVRTGIEKPNGKRAVVVVDRGWIFAGDVTRKDGRILIENAVWVFKWDTIGFSGVLKNPEKADIRPIDDIDMPAGSEVFCVPVDSEWGKK